MACARRFAIVNIALIVADFAVWLLYELPHLNSAVYHASFNAQANGGGVAFFAHVGGFVFGALVTRLLVRAGQATPQLEVTR
jgi:membrane associated rhomboid family serine protease